MPLVYHCPSTENEGMHTCILLCSDSSFWRNVVVAAQQYRACVAYNQAWGTPHFIIVPMTTGYNIVCTLHPSLVSIPFYAIPISLSMIHRIFYLLVSSLFFCCFQQGCWHYSHIEQPSRKLLWEMKLLLQYTCIFYYTGIVHRDIDNLPQPLVVQTDGPS